MEHPGLILEKEMKKCNMSRKELALRTGVSEKHICTVFSGVRGISSVFARKLGYVFHDARYWMKLQYEYDFDHLRVQEESEITVEEFDVLKQLHDIMQYFIEKGYMHNDCDEISKVMQLRTLLNVSNLTVIPEITYNATYQAQLSSNAKVNPYVLFAWQRLCEKETENNEIQKAVDIQLLRSKLPEIKAMMFGNINTGIRKLQELFAECGIAFQVIKNFRGAPVQGFIKEITGNRLILCLTIRRQRADTFWFTLFHEIAHILNGDYSTRFVDFDTIYGEIETRANEFASNELIDPKLYRDFLQSNTHITWSNIEKFAKEANVQSFIVLGRLQNDGILDWSDYAEKVVRYMWA